MSSETRDSDRERFHRLDTFGHVEAKTPGARFRVLHCDQGPEKGVFGLFSGAYGALSP
jgi:hypothetical protein